MTRTAGWARVAVVVWGLMALLWACLGCAAGVPRAGATEAKAAPEPASAAYEEAGDEGWDEQGAGAAQAAPSDKSLRSHAAGLSPAPPPAAFQPRLAQAPERDEAATEPSGNADAPGEPAEVSDVATAPKAVAAPLLIYKAELRMAVFEAAESIDAVEQAARDAGGYLVHRDDVTITVRVPAGKFQGTLKQVLKLGDVLHRDVQVRDVTDQYYDLQVRLRNAQAVLARLEQLLGRANSVQEALAVEAELSRVAEQVEQLKGRLRLLRELIAFSTITVRFEGRPVEQIESTTKLPFPWLGGLGLSSLLSL